MIINKKRLGYILTFIMVLSLYSCIEHEVVAGFEDLEQYSIYDYLMENKEEFSSFISILEKGNLDKTLSAYNPNGVDYTLFLPNNQAIDDFIDKSTLFTTLDDILNDSVYASAFSRYHVLNMGINTNQFPFGAFPEPTLTGDFLTVSFIVETDTSYYKINNQSTVVMSNIELSNGYIHHIKEALSPITISSYQWLEQNADYSIFKESVDLTGLRPTIDFNKREEEDRLYITMLVEPDYIYNDKGISTAEDLAKLISPDDNDYTNPSNPFYNFVAYHILSGQYYLDNFEGIASNFSTFSDVPLNINGNGIDILINKGKEIFDTIVVQTDTTIIDYVGILYDKSNVNTQSGSIHFVDQIMKQQIPSRTSVTFEFNEEPLFNSYRQESGTFQIDENEDVLYFVDWLGADLFFVDLGDEESSARNADYLEINGDFEISYEISQIVTGKYYVFIGAEAFNDQNALIEVFIDGNKLGSLVDLSTGGSSSSPFQSIEIGTIDFKSFSTHKVEVKPVIPGRFLWDYIRFEPY